MNDIVPAQQRLMDLYSSATFEKAAEVWGQVLSDHFRSLSTRAPHVLNWSEPESNVSLAKDSLSGRRSADDVERWLPEFQRLLVRALEHGQNLHHPRYVGHQVPASVPVAALFDALGSATNQVMAIYEMGPWATAVERVMIDRLGEEIGYRAGEFSGLVTSGGSLANLTALLTARNVALPDAWKQGVRESDQAVLVVQEDAHYCVLRAAGVLGLGTDHIHRVPVDQHRKMDVVALTAVLRRLAAEGQKVVAVVAAACATPFGSFDPLEQIADVCQEFGVWMHVDAAHGGGVLMSPQYRHCCDGLSRADSVVWDAHKMLFMPALCAFVFYKRRQHRFLAFQQDAPYLFDPSNPGIAEYDSGAHTVECTKRAAAMPLWGMWSLFGRELFADLVNVTLGTTRLLYDKLRAASDFLPLHEPECNIQVFRYVPDSAQSWPNERLGDFQLDLRRQLIQNGFAYIVPIKIDNMGALRATVMNPCTSETDLEALLEEVRRVGNSLLA